MAQIQSVTSPKLKTYLSKLDANDAPRTIRNLSFALLANDQTIDVETHEKIELLVHGPWVYVQVLQGDNLTSENIDFVAQNNTEWGNKGKKFWEIVGGGFEFTNNSDSGTSLDLTKLLTPKKYTSAKSAALSNLNTTTFLSIATALQGLLDYRPQRFKGLQDLCLTRMDIFIEFMAEWEKEDRLQNPDKYPVPTNPIPKTPQQQGTKTPEPTNTDNSDSGIYLILILVLLFFVLKSSNKKTTKKRN
jgi:hypothetical protein